MKKCQLIPAVGYIRMSTDRQEDSPERQRTVIEVLAERSGYKIVRWYEDHGLTGTESTKRPEFQQLLKDAENGKVQALLLAEISRWSREGVWDAMVYWRILWRAGVRIVSGDMGDLNLDDMGGIISLIVKQHGAHDESVKLAARVVSAQKIRAKRGDRIGGRAFAYDREIRDERGQVVKVVHFRDVFRKPHGWTSKFVITKDLAALEAIRFAFRAVLEGQSLKSIVAEFRRRGVTTTLGKRYSISVLREQLTNPVYAGILRVGKYSNGKFCRVDDEGLIIVQGNHEPLIDPREFAAVQRIFERRKRHVERGEAGRYLVSGIVRCGHCGNLMYGVYRTRGSKFYLFYQCSYETDRTDDSDCPRPAVQCGRLEAVVLDSVRELLGEGDIEARVRRGLQRWNSGTQDDRTYDERRLLEVRAKIANGIDNLSACKKVNMPGIEANLDKWRSQEANLVEKIERHSENAKPFTEALETIGSLATVRDHLHLADRAKLSNALSETIETIEIRVENIGRGDIAERELSGRLCFLPQLGAEPVLFSDRQLGKPKVWLSVADYVCGATQPVRLIDVKAAFQMADVSLALYHLKQAARRGYVRKLGFRRGWVSC